MSLGYMERLYVLAFDHRSSFQKGLFGVRGEPTAEETASIARSKRIIFDGLQRAVREGGLDRRQTGVLVDEHFGAEVARNAKRLGLTLAMPVEKSGQEEFDFEYGDRFGDHIEAFDPALAKVLVRYNPEGDEAMNHRQLDRLRRLSEWLRARDRKFLFELLVPPLAEQLERAGGEEDRYDAELRPRLVVDAIEAAQSAGVEPDIWKIEGLETRADCEKVVAQAHAEGRDQVSCVVLGRGASSAKVAHWLREGARVAGFTGFAVGRTIWWDALSDWVAGTVDAAGAASLIAQNYRKMVATYVSAAKQAPAG
jgi:myo-inositol catabolism protein IolC